MKKINMKSILIAKRRMSTSSVGALQDLLNDFPSSFMYAEECLTTKDEKVLLDAFEKPLRRRKYEGSHWDDVISKYKEIQVEEAAYGPDVSSIIEKCKTLIARFVNKDIIFLPPHVIDLAADGRISAHVDSIKFSGDFIAGFSLLSSRVLRLEKQQDITQATPRSYELRLEPRSMYILHGPLRYDFSHAVLGTQDTPRIANLAHNLSIERRLSLMLRDVKCET
jgi:alkylated DNA repair protein alkB family protein 7